MSEQALINPIIVTWARERAGLSAEVLARKLGVKNVEKILDWEKGKLKPTFNQAYKIAQIVKIPFGYLFLQEPPQEELPIPDLRTIGDHHTNEVSIEMRDVIKQVMHKQDWYRDYLLTLDYRPLPFVGAFTTNSDVVEVAENIRDVLQVPLPTKGTWEEYQKLLIQGAENSRILVMRSGIVGNNTHRKLQVNEFRGFAICDEIAPVVFINSSDAPTARLFTLIHELAHIWIGSSGISDVESSHEKEESFCNAVAGEFLVPIKSFYDIWDEKQSVDSNLINIYLKFHVSTLVAAKRALDCNVISKDTYWAYYRNELSKFQNKKGNGGSFYRSAGAKNSGIFSSAVVAEALSGRMLLRDAGRLLGINPNKIKTYASTLSL